MKPYRRLRRSTLLDSIPSLARHAKPNYASANTRINALKSTVVGQKLGPWGEAWLPYCADDAVRSTAVILIGKPGGFDQYSAFDGEVAFGYIFHLPAVNDIDKKIICGRGSGYLSISTLKSKGDEGAGAHRIVALACSCRRVTGVCNRLEDGSLQRSPQLSPFATTTTVSLFLHHLHAEIACLAVQGLKNCPCAPAPSWLSLGNCC